MTNFMVDPTVVTDKEREALKQFKDRIQDVLPTLREYNRHDISLLRWLRARELNVTQSEEMLRKSIAWRAINDIDNRRNWKVPDTIDNKYPYYISGFDKNGNIIICILSGRWVFPKAAPPGFKSDIICYVDQLLEVMMHFMETKSTMDSIKTQCCVIFDYEGFSIKQNAFKDAIQFSLEFARRLEANYPEIVCTAWVINAPKIFEILFAIIKPLLTPRTLSKLRVFGCNSDQWRQALLEAAEPDQLPSTHGGSNTSCKYYKTSYGLDIFPVHKMFPENSEFIPVTIDAGMKYTLKYTLLNNCKLYWNFRSVDYDIGFSFVYFNADLAAEEIVFKCARADSHLHLQTGLFVAEKPGTYTLVFDNSFSRFRKKSIFYFTRVNTDADTGIGGDRC